MEYQEGQKYKSKWIYLLLTHIPIYFIIHPKELLLINNVKFFKILCFIFFEIVLIYFINSWNLILYMNHFEIKLKFNNLITRDKNWSWEDIDYLELKENQNGNKGLGWILWGKHRYSSYFMSKSDYALFICTRKGKNFLISTQKPKELNAFLEKLAIQKNIKYIKNVELKG